MKIGDFLDESYLPIRNKRRQTSNSIGVIQARGHCDLQQHEDLKLQLLYCIYGELSRCREEVARNSCIACRHYEALLMFSNPECSIKNRLHAQKTLVLLLFRKLESIFHS